MWTNSSRILYIAATTMAALAHERYTAFLRSEVYAQRCSRHTPTTASRLGAWEPRPPMSAMIESEDDIRPVVPPRAASRVNTWVFDESNNEPIFAEKQAEGSKRVLSVRNV